MNPSRYQLPQYVSEDRQRARAATLRLERARFAWKRDTPPEPLLTEMRPLPPWCAQMPTEVKFPSAKITVFSADKLTTVVNTALVSLSSLLIPLNSVNGYRAMFRLVRGPHASMDRWEDDADFGRQRLTGVNPMQLKLLRDDERTPLWQAGERVLAQRSKLTMQEAFFQRRLFVTDYSLLAHPRVQQHVRAGASLAAPTCLFWTDDYGALMPLAIQLRPRGFQGPNPVLTPLSPRHDWMLARAHAQAADTHMHEGIYHLLETHLISEAVAMAMYRRLHPDHPLRQLLEPHFEYNLAIDDLARGGLVAPGGTIDTAVAGGVSGIFDAMRLYYQDWNYLDRSLERDLHARGVDDPTTLPRYYYREDGRALHDAIANYTTAILRLWYRHDGDVEADHELQAFVHEASSAEGSAIPGFPTQIHSFAQLTELATEMIFRAGPQHAAVNNGQFDAYGWIPNTPAVVMGDLPTMEPTPQTAMTAKQFWQAMPPRNCALAQLGMVWILSRPTERTILHSGESPAFHPSLCYEADEIIGGFRRRLQSISDDIQRRNDTLDLPYRYMDPLNVSRSTDI